MDKTPNIIICEDDPLLLASLLAAAARCGFHAEGADDGRAAMEILGRSQHFDLLVTDIRMPDIDGLALIAWVREHVPDIRIVVITGYASVEYAVACLKAGAVDFLIKPFDESDFADSIIHAASITRPGGQEQAGHGEGTEEEGVLKLTAREQEVLRWAKDGKNNWEIATILDISEATTKFHLANIYKKLSVTNRAAAVAQAVLKKLV